MIERIIRFCSANALLVVFVTVVISILTVVGLRKLALDALPDLSDTQVIVFADWPGRSPDIIENQLTYPLTTSLLSTSKVKYVRGTSMPGATQIVVVFEDGVDLYWARSRVSEKIASVSGLPAGVVPQLGPEATGLGWVFQYSVVDKSGKLDLAQLRSLQDWHLRLALQSVPGVAEVAAVGGFVKQYQVDLEPYQLQSLGLSPLQVVRAIRAGNQEIGAGTLELGGTEYSIRGRGYLKSVEEISEIPVVSQKGGRIIKVGDIASVHVGPAARSGVAELDGDGEAVGGIVVMRIGENALNVIERIKSRFEELKPSLPAGVEIVPVYDRSTLISNAIQNLRSVLTEEIIVVSLIVSIFLWHARASFVAILPLPIAVLLSFLPMIWSGLTANIMSLGGIALAIGAMVDSAIILIENAHKKLEGLNTTDLPPSERRQIITDAIVAMGRPLFFSLLVITVSFLPIFALEGREGRLFKPLAFTKTVSMAWAAVLAITLTPALAVLFLKGRFVHEDKHFISRFLHIIYTPVVEFSIKFRYAVVAAAVLIVVLSIPIFLAIPSEFMPALNEGTILYMPTSVSGMSVDTAAEILQKQDTIIKTLPEVEHVFGKAGRANSATDPAPISMFETVITLKPKNTWRSGVTFEKIISELNAKLDFPGMPNIWWMPIQTRIEMLSTGIRTAVGVKVMGSNLEDIAKASVAVEAALKGVPGTRSAFAERVASGSFVDIEIDRNSASLYGLNSADIQSVVEIALAGVPASVLVVGRERYTIQVKYLHDYRSSLSAIEDVIIPTPDGRVVKLGQVANVVVRNGAPMISSENSRLLGFVFVDVNSSVGLSEYVADAKVAVAKNVKLPEGVTLAWSGQFEALERARATLLWVVPITLFLILLLLYFNTKSAIETGIVLCAVPFSLVGAFWLMWILNYKMSVASWVGVLALAGLDAETGVVMLLYLTHAWKDRLAAGKVATWDLLDEAIHEGAVRRVRPKLMTVAAALVGLLPVMWSTGTGAEVMKRIAAPMVGGIVTSGILELVVYPALFAIWQSWVMKKNLSKSSQ